MFATSEPHDLAPSQQNVTETAGRRRGTVLDRSRTLRAEHLEGAHGAALGALVAFLLVRLDQAPHLGAAAVVLGTVAEVDPVELALQERWDGQAVPVVAAVDVPGAGDVLRRVLGSGDVPGGVRGVVQALR